MGQPQGGIYRDQTRWANWTKWLLYLEAAVSAVAIVFFIESLHLLDVFEAEAWDAGTELRAETIDRRLQTTAIASLFAFIVAGGFTLIWIFRANANARALGAQRMAFSPMGAIGWYIVPIANLILPFQAMREIWQASSKPRDPLSAATPRFLLGGWWFLWLATNFSAAVAYRIADVGTELAEYRIAAYVSIASAGANVLLCLVFTVIIARIQHMQTALASGRSEAA